MPTDLTVNLSTDVGVNRKLRGVLGIGLKEFTMLFSECPPAGEHPIQVYYRLEGPTVRLVGNPRFYWMGLGVCDLTYDQLLFQFGHELCHIFTDPRCSNWFVESCCEMMSQKMLRIMSAVWTARRMNFLPESYLGRVIYARKIEKYADQWIGDANEQIFGCRCLPDQAPLLAWWTTVRGSLGQNPVDRQRNVIIAEMLSPLFEKSNKHWDALCFLGKATDGLPINSMEVCMNSDFRFDKWMQAVPENLKDFVKEIRDMLEGVTSPEGTS